MFTKHDVQKFAEEIGELRAEVKALRSEKDARQRATKLEEEVDNLKRKLSDLRIEESKLTEKHERERRETEHMVGLERKRQEFEIEQARRETTVEVREQALKGEKAQFEEQLKFITDRLSKEVAYLKDDILKAVLDRLPTVTVDRTIEERRGQKTARRAVK